MFEPLIPVSFSVLMRMEQYFHGVYGRTECMNGHFTITFTKLFVDLFVYSGQSLAWLGPGRMALAWRTLCILFTYPQWYYTIIRTCTCSTWTRITLNIENGLSLSMHTDDTYTIMHVNNIILGLEMQFK